MQVLQNRRVLLLTEEYPPATGGIQNYLSQLMAQLSPAHTFVITQKRADSDVWDREQKYKIVRVNMHGFFWPRWQPAYKALEKAVKEFQPEIIVCGKALFEGRAALKIWKKYQIPYVVMTYGMEVNTWLEGGKTRRDLKNVLTNATRIIVINDLIKKTLIKFLGSEKENKIVKIYPGVGAMFIEELKKINHSDAKIIITVCRLVSRKGVDVVIRALPEVLKIFPQTTYQIIGDGPERSKLEDLVGKLGLKKQVNFLGKVTDSELWKSLNDADLFVLTPRDEAGNFEGFGIVYLEAAAAGTCAVASRSGGVPEAVLDGVTGLLCEPDNPKDTADKIIKLLKNDELREKLNENAHKRVVDDFTWEKRAVLFRGVVESVVTSNRLRQ
ncbi:MAG: glycosyltransferase family 4 protein [bacterium]|nr:glycosyltransferase family 4 protein [bacterium]